MAKKRIEKIPKSFQEIPFPYEGTEYELWKSGDENVRKRLLKVCGGLGKDMEHYYRDQNDQNYPEVRYAVHLVQNKGFRPRCIRYETFRLSQKFIETQLGKPNMEARRFVDGHDLLCEVFKKDFFEEFDELCELNKEIITTRKNIYKISVDLCAINHDKRQVHFTETKKINTDKPEHEGFKTTFHQLFCLGFIRHIIDSLGKKVFIDEIYEVITEIVVLVPKQRYSELIDRLKPRPVEFYIDRTNNTRC